MNFKDIIIDFDTIEISKSGTVTGCICLSFDNGNYFPELKWNDRVLDILNSWTDGIYNLKNKISREEEFFFFDGPFYFVIETISESNKIIIFPDKAYSFLDLESFKEKLIEVFIKLINFLDSQALNNMDLDDIKFNLLKLKKSK